MSQRAADGIRDGMEARGPMRLTEVLDAQKTMIQIARALAKDGTIMLGGGKDDYVSSAQGGRPARFHRRLRLAPRACRSNSGVDLRAPRTPFRSTGLQAALGRTHPAQRLSWRCAAGGRVTRTP